MVGTLQRSSGPPDMLSEDQRFFNFFRACIHLGKAAEALLKQMPSSVETQTDIQATDAREPAPAPAKVHDAGEPAEVHDASEPAEDHNASEPAEVHDASEPTEVHNASKPAEVHAVDKPAEGKPAVKKKTTEVNTASKTSAEVHATG